jgi:hypothetical protein
MRPVGIVPAGDPPLLHALVLTSGDARTMCSDDGAELGPGEFDPLAEASCRKCAELAGRL